MRLALAVGRLDVDRMLDELTVDQWEEWLAYDRVEGIPFPWLQTGVVARELANRLRGTGERAKVAADFMPIVRPGKTATPKKPAEMMAVFRTLAGEIKPCP